MVKLEHLMMNAVFPAIFNGENVVSVTLIIGAISNIYHGM